MGDTINKDGLRVPEHVAIILDGNGRWAKKRHLPRNAGHIQGCKNVEPTCDAAYHMGIKYLTLYAFSTENWKRPKAEVDALMKLLEQYLKECIDTRFRHNMKVRIIGDRTKFTPKLQGIIEELEEVSKDDDGLNLIISINYGSRDEIIRSVKDMYRDIEDDKISIDDVDESMLSKYLDTKDIPDVDLMIRTSGEQRISNFLLWQMAYSELYFTDTFWPDFNSDELKKAIEFYNTRERRFGNVK